MHRRDFIRDFLLGAAAQGIVGNSAYDAVVHTAEKAWALASTPRGAPFSERFSLDTSKAVKTLFSSKRGVLKIVGGRAHYQYPKTMHPDDKWACEMVAQYAERLTEKHDYDPDAGIPSWAGSFVCTGSPVSNAFTRTFLDYAYIDSAKPALGLMRADRPTLNLPFQFELRPKILERFAKPTQHSAEARRSERNWSIRHRSGDFFVPNTQDKTSDLLLISRIPNWIEPREPHQEYNGAVTIIGGTHGVGTSGLKLLLEDVELLKRILLKAARYEYWQVLLTIDKMELGAHPHSKATRLIAKSIGQQFLCEPVHA